MIFYINRKKSITRYSITILFFAFTVFWGIIARGLYYKMAAGVAAILLPFAIYTLFNHLRMKGPIVVIDGRGIEDNRLRLGIIPWGDVSTVMIRNRRKQYSLCLELTNSEQYLSRLSFANKFLHTFHEGMECGHLEIAFAELRPSIDEAIEFIRREALKKVNYVDT